MPTVDATGVVGVVERMANPTWVTLRYLSMTIRPRPLGVGPWAGLCPGTLFEAVRQEVWSADLLFRLRLIGSWFTVLITWFVTSLSRTRLLVDKGSRRSTTAVNPFPCSARRWGWAVSVAQPSIALRRDVRTDGNESGGLVIDHGVGRLLSTSKIVKELSL